MKITVSEKDIKLGLKTICSNLRCPVARAIRRAGLKGVTVGVGWAKTKYGEIILPDTAIKAILGMCDTSTMQPFSFTLNKKQVNILTGN